MASVRQPAGCSVLEAAQRRVGVLFDRFRSVVVSFSGGKDSLVVLELVRREAERRGRLVDAFFLDEELIADSIVENVDHYRRQPWLRLLWFCYPLRSSKFILGRSIYYTQWDPNREHVRQPAPWAIRPAPGEELPEDFDQPSFNRLLPRYFEGQIACVVGLRAEESIFRLRSQLRNPKGFDCFIFKARTGCPRVNLVRPIYDWSENDVLKFIYENKLRYCALYDAQHLMGGGLRVASEITAEGAKKLRRLRSTCPTLYRQVQRLFPEMMVQERYWAEFDKQAVVRQFGMSWDGIRRYIAERVEDPVQRDMANLRLDEVLERNAKTPGAYTVRAAWAFFLQGAYKRRMTDSKEQYDLER